uniref:Secreted RxLR effector protein 111 n=1 Tax=Plasmopara viticola TaxID=143451 RepID=RL111_PLAVT|nr:RecName: Full=Secreted RxLR effector protein 111; Flags: Precursor [Plasmopara viticola]
MRGTLATALLLVASCRIAAESNQINPQQASHHVGTTLNKLFTKSSPRRFLRDNREQRVALALTAANESRTIENAVTSAVHGITDASTTTAATRDAARDILNQHAFPKEGIRPQFDLNLPPSETSALLTGASNIPQRNHAFSSITSGIAVSSSRTSNQRTAKTQANLDMSHQGTVRKTLSKTQFKNPAASKSTKRRKKARIIPPFVVNKVDTLYREHLTAKSLEFDPTIKETEAMLKLYVESTVDPLPVSTVHFNHFRYFKDQDLTLLKEKLGTTLESALSTLAALNLPPGMLKAIERPFVWYASLARWRAMYCDFFEFLNANSNKIATSLPNVEFFGGETSSTVRDQLLATLKEEMKTRTKTRRNGKIMNDLKVVLAKYNVEEEIKAAIRGLGEQFLKRDHEIIPLQRHSRRSPASQSRSNNQRTGLTPYGLQIPGPERDSFRHIESNKHA